MTCHYTYSIEDFSVSYTRVCRNVCTISLHNLLALSPPSPFCWPRYIWMNWQGHLQLLLWFVIVLLQCGIVVLLRFCNVILVHWCGVATVWWCWLWWYLKVPSWFNMLLCGMVALFWRSFWLWKCGGVVVMTAIVFDKNDIAVETLLCWDGMQVWYVVLCNNGIVMVCRCFLYISMWLCCCSCVDVFHAEEVWRCTAVVVSCCPAEAVCSNVVLECSGAVAHHVSRRCGLI